VIRIATIEDSAVLSKLVLRAAESVRGSDFTEKGWQLLEQTNTVDAFRQRFNSSDYFALIYQHKGTPVGYLAMIDLEKVDHMFVLPEFRRIGVSAKLWQRARQVCEESGKGDYYWVRSSTVAEQVYRSFGFRDSGERLDSNGISSRFMELGTKPDREIGESDA